MGKRKSGRRFCVFPAGAGVILSDVEAIEENQSFPRRCGGDPPTDEIYVIDRTNSLYIEVLLV